MPLYRVENLNDYKGLWYNVRDGSSTRLIHDLNLTNKELPMEFDEAIGKELWRSAADSIEQLKFWFSQEDLNKLRPLGFQLYEIHASVVKQNETPFYSHPLFQEISVTKRVELDIGILSKE